MSEYQYYEFLAVERPLTREEMADVRKYSSRAEITATHFMNEYNWGGFRGDVNEFLARYYDLHVYLANWGSRRFAFRVPAGTLDLKAARAYSCETLTATAAGEHVIVDMRLDLEDPDDFSGGAGWMATLAPLRQELLSGDWRCLYLAWLANAAAGAYDGEYEPPVPAGLRSLSAAQRGLVDFFELDCDLLDVVGESSLAESGDAGLRDWIASLPSGEKDAALWSTLEGRGSYVAAELRRRFRDATSARGTRPKKPVCRRVDDLVAQANRRTELRMQENARRRAEEEARRKAEEAAKRQAFLAGLAERQPALWKRVETLVSSKQPARYDEAVTLLRDLRDAAAMHGGSPHFDDRLIALRADHGKKPSFIKRLNNAGLR